MQSASSLKEHSHPRTQTCSLCRCQSPSLWAEGETEKSRIVSIICLDRRFKAGGSDLWLTPFVERATKCLATAAFCRNREDMIEVKWSDSSEIEHQLANYWNPSANEGAAYSRLWHVQGTMLWPTQRWLWSLGWWMSLNGELDRKKYINNQVLICNALKCMI